MQYASKRLYGVLLLLVSLSGCSSLAEEEALLEVHLQSSFEGEHVRVEIDGREVFEGPVQTNHLLGLAEVIKLERREGNHRIRIDVDGAFSAERRFDLKDRLFIGVTFYRADLPEADIQEGIHFLFSEQGFGYF